MTAATDVLAGVLQMTRVNSVRHCRIEAARPWTLRVAAGSDPTFHLVLSGRAVLRVEDDGDLLELAARSAVALPHGHAHVLYEGSGPSTDLDDLLSNPKGEAERRLGPGPVSTLLISGRFRFEEGRGNPLLSALPAVVRVAGHDGRSPSWLEAVVACMSDETRLAEPGSQAVMSRLVDVLFVHMVRAHMKSTAGDAAGWLSALSEPSIGDALGLVHERPAEPWTVSSLAARVGMSRSSFAARFTQLVGEAPLHYVTRWRMHKAAELLRVSQMSLAEVGLSVGYDSEAAFSKAFKRWSRVSPGAYRRSAQREAG